MLYPLKFKPRFKERMWGGRSLAEKLNKKLPAGKPVGESWEIADIGRDVSVVCNGPLAGNNLRELIEVYMGDLIGDRIYEKFGIEFPLLVKYIDACEPLSVQVHPTDTLAAERHGAYGKTEMWYVVDCREGAELTVGFDGPVSQEEYLRHVERNTLPDILSKREVRPGDAFFIPSGTIHSIGGGILIAEIQQTSDVTYRIYDWGRRDAEGRSRELHTGLAADAIDFSPDIPYRVTAEPKPGQAVLLKKCPYFTTNRIDLDGTMLRDHIERDSFVIYMLLDGKANLRWDGGEEPAVKGETVLLPACIESVALSGRGTLLEIYID